MTTVTCIDSSALLRLCFGEGDFTLVEQALAAVPTISVLAAVEMPCAISARYHRGALTEDARNRMLAKADEILETVGRIGLTAEVRREAVSLGQRFLLRALDAIHVASALLVARRQRRRGNVVRFCTADLRQADVAVALLGAGRVDVVPPLPQHAP